MINEQELYEKTLKYMKQREENGHGTISIQMIQRRFLIGYSPVARLMDRLEAERRVSPYNGSKPRIILK